MWLFRKQLVDVVSCKLEKRISNNNKKKCPRELFHNANSEKQTTKVMSGIHALFIIWSIFIETTWWVIHNNNNKTPRNPGVFRSLQTDNRVAFQCVPGFEVSMKKWPLWIEPLFGSKWNTGATAHPGLYRSVLQCSLQFLGLTRIWQECFLALSCPACPLFPHGNQGTKGRRGGCQGLACQELETGVVNPWSWAPAPASEQAALPAPPEVGLHCSSAFYHSITLHFVIAVLNPADNLFSFKLISQKGSQSGVKRMRDGEAILSHFFFILKCFWIEISRFGNVVSLKVFISIFCLKGCEEWFFFDREILKPEFKQLN